MRGVEKKKRSDGRRKEGDTDNIKKIIAREEKVVTCKNASFFLNKYLSLITILSDI